MGTALASADAELRAHRGAAATHQVTISDAIAKRDAYKTTGCYNLDCSGFIQTNNAVFIGGKISPVSSYAGAQYEYTVLVFKVHT
eukprot:SM008035S22601  [mRNA]  locus=s8035:275:540:+ [translate_table: standard]